MLITVNTFYKIVSLIILIAYIVDSPWWITAAIIVLVYLRICAHNTLVLHEEGRPY